MKTTTKTAEPCAVHGVRHRPGSTAALTCEALAAKTDAAAPPAPGRAAAAPQPLRHFTAAPVQVTAEDLRQVLTGRAGSLRRRIVAPGHHVVTVLALNLGDLVADAQGVRDLVDVFDGDLDAAAFDLTLALQHEQRHDVTA